MTPIGHICAHSRKPPPSIKGFLDHGAPPPNGFLIQFAPGRIE